MTRVTVETCAQCGWPRRNVGAQESVVALRDIATGYADAVAAVLSQDASHALIRLRPSPDVWSIAEYVAHAADAMEHIDRRAHALLTEDDPELSRFGDPNAHDYSAVDVGDALARLQAACTDLAHVFDSATPRELDRAGHNSLGTATLLDTAGYAVHEAGHHLHDIQQIALAIVSI